MLWFNFLTCRVELKFSFFALLAFCGTFAGFSSGAVLFAAVLLHELSHLAAMLCFHSPPERFTVSALGCRLQKRPQCTLSYGRNAVISLAGPIGNLVVFASLFALGHGDTYFAMCNLTLFALHILPIEPLDGGMALHYFLDSLLSKHTADKITTAVSLIFLFPISLLGFAVLLNTRYNFTLLAMCCYLMLYLLLKRSDLTE